MKSNIPEVSVITACFNSDCFIEQTIKSVIGQTFTNFEFIIVDDCSSDKTVNIIKKYLRLDHRLKLYELSSNQGAAKARNYAINKSCGRFIAFLDSDDLWYKSKLKDQITFMLHNKYYFTYSYFQLVDEHSNFIKEVFVPRRICYKRLLSYQAIGCLTAIYDRQYFGTVYMPEIKRRQDFALWLKLLKSVQYAHCIPKNLASYRIAKKSLSSNKLKAISFTFLVYYKIEKFGIIKSLFYLTMYLFNSFKRYI